MSTLHLVDATYELFRHHYGAPPRTAPDGSAIGAVYGLCQSLLMWLRRGEVTHIACATDHVVESFRNEMFDGYKTGEGIEPELLAQFPVAEEAMEALGLVVWPMVEFEADDALATAAKRYARGFERIVIATPDKDLAQCVEGDRVVQWDRRKDEIRDEPGVVEKFGVGPASIPDYLALVGDAADGIPGIPAWGAKSTSTVLAHYERLEAIPDDPETWEVKVRGAKRLATNLTAERENAALYKELAILRTDVPLKEKKADLEWKGARKAGWAPFCERMGFDRLVERPARWR